MSDSWIAVGRSSSLTVGRSSSRAAASAARPHRHALATTLAPAHVRTRASDMHKCMHKCIHTSTAWQRQLARAHTCSQRRGSALSAKVVEEMVLGSQSTCHLAASDVSGETASISPSGPSKKVSDIGPLRLLLRPSVVARHGYHSNIGAVLASQASFDQINKPPTTKETATAGAFTHGRTVVGHARSNNGQCALATGANDQWASAMVRALRRLFPRFCFT